MQDQEQPVNESIVDVAQASADSPIVLVCEHASAHIPAEFENLGLPPELLDSHVVWDIGAKGLATGMASHLDATLVAARTSRLVYDCNRPPHAPDAMPERSEVVEVPGNRALSVAQRRDRVQSYYLPFRAAVSQTLARIQNPVLVTVHSFTPVYHGKPRDVEIGILHDTDARLADALLERAPAHTDHIVRKNEPYGPRDGVTHTLREHALPGGHLNVMVEVRNDLLASRQAQDDMAFMLSGWIRDALQAREGRPW